MFYKNKINEKIENDIEIHKQMIKTSKKFINIYKKALEEANKKELDYVEVVFRISTGVIDLNGNIEWINEIERKSIDDTIKLINALEKDCKKSMEIIKELEDELNKLKGGK